MKARTISNSVFKNITRKFPGITLPLDGKMKFPDFCTGSSKLKFDSLSAQLRKLNFNASSYIMLFTDYELHLRKDIELDEFVLDRIDGKDSLIT